jgi:hypothetical protein
MVVVEHVKRRGPAPTKKEAPTTRPMDRREIADAVAEFKDMARRIRPPLNMQPNAFHEDKSELVRAAARLEDAIRYNRPLRKAADALDQADGKARSRP